MIESPSSQIKSLFLRHERPRIVDIGNMEGSDDGVGSKVARDLHRSIHVSAIQNVGSATANGEFQRVPEAALDALIETAWAFPGCRVSFGAFEGRTAIRFCTSVGAERMRNLDGLRIDLHEAPRLLEACRRADVPFSIEDTQTDSRARPIAAQLEAIDARSVVMLPLRDGRNPHPFGVVMMDRDAARTWGPKEGAALDRLAPVVALALEHIQACGELEITKSRAAEHERRVDAIRGLTQGVAMDAERLLDALTQQAGADDPVIAGMLGQLARVVDELERVQSGPTTIDRPYDVSTMLASLAPGLGALCGITVTIESDSLAPLHVAGHRTGLERVLVAIAEHVSRGAPANATMLLSLSCSPDGLPQLRMHGDAVQIDAPLIRLAAGQALATDDGPTARLWQARCEALVQGIELGVDASAVTLFLPAVEVSAPNPARSQSTG